MFATNHGKFPPKGFGFSLFSFSTQLWVFINFRVALKSTLKPHLRRDRCEFCDELPQAELLCTAVEGMGTNNRLEKQINKKTHNELPLAMVIKL